MSKFLLGIIVTIAAFGLLGGAYYFGTQQTTSKTTSISPTSQAQAEPSPTNTPEPTSTKEFVNPSVVIENIKDGISSKNYSALEGYMAPKVLVTLHASECCGMLAPDKATQQLSYTTNGKAPWDFSDTNPIAAKLRTSDPANFKDSAIGTSSNKFAIAFHLDDKYRIDKIFMVIDYQLITQ